MELIADILLGGGAIGAGLFCYALSRRLAAFGTLEGGMGGAVAIQAEVSLSEMFGYVTQLRTLTSGRASSTMEFSHYAPPPDAVAKAVIEAARGGK